MYFHNTVIIFIIWLLPDTQSQFHDLKSNPGPEIDFWNATLTPDTKSTLESYCGPKSGF